MATMKLIDNGYATGITTVHFSNHHAIHLKDDELKELKELLSTWEAPEDTISIGLSLRDYNRSISVDIAGDAVTVTFKGELLKFLDAHYSVGDFT